MDIFTHYVHVEEGEELDSIKEERNWKVSVQCLGGGEREAMEVCEEVTHTAIMSHHCLEEEERKFEAGRSSRERMTG